MSITTHAELKTAVASWLARTDLSSYLDDLIMVAERHIFRRIRSREMEAALSVAVTSGTASVPSDFVELKYAYIDGPYRQPLDIRPSHWLLQQFPNTAASSTPLYIAVDGSQFKLAPRGSGTISGIYYKRLTAISASGVNELFTNNPDLYLYATLAESKMFVMDESRVLLWEAKRDQLIKQVNDEAKASHYGSNMAVRLA